VVFKRENLVAAMFTRRKDDRPGSFEPIGGSKLLGAGIALLAVAAGVFAQVTLL